MYCTVEQKEDLGDIFAQIKDVDEQIFSAIIEMIPKEKLQDYIGSLSDNGNQRNFEQQIQQGENLAQINNIKHLINVLKKIKDYDFNQIDYSTKGNYKYSQDLIDRIRDERKIIEFLKLLVHLTSIDNTLIKCGSNSLNLLVKMKVDLRNQNFENIKIWNTSLVGANFVRCNLSGSEFDNVDISGMNLNGLYYLIVNGKTLKYMNQINQMVILIVSYQYAFLRMELYQHLVVMIGLSVYGMLIQDNKNPNWMVIVILSITQTPGPIGKPGNFPYIVGLVVATQFLAF